MPAEFSFPELLNHLEGLLLLVMLGAMIYCGAGFVMKRGGPWPKVFIGGSIAVFLAFGLRTAAVVISVFTLSTSSSLTPDIPVTYETWDFFGSLLGLVFGGGFLASGVALIFIAAAEGKRGKKRTRKRARSRKK